MRQRDDAIFAAFLSRIRVGNITSDDIELLKTRIITEEMDNNHSYLHLFPTNRQVDIYNINLLSKLSAPMRTFTASDKIPDKFPVITIPSSDIKSGGLPSVLQLKQGCRIMLIRNIDVQHGLVNGAIGSVTGFVENTQRIRSTNCTPTAILVQFDDIKNQTWASATFPHYENYVPIEQFEARFPITYGRGNKFVEATRLQFPLKVAYANTIHKCQGQTLDNVVISMDGRFGPGQAYVALSRCRSLEGLHILDFKTTSIKTNLKSLQSVDHLSQQNPFTEPHKLFLGNTGLRIASINCRSWNSHSEDAIADPYISNCQIAVFTETRICVNTLVNIPLRSSIVCSPPIPNHGGVMVSLSNDMTYDEIFRVVNDNIQIFALRIQMPNNSTFRQLILVSLYRSPSSKYTFFEAIIHEHIIPLLTTNDSNYQVIVLGDFNVNDLDPKHKDRFLNCPQYITQSTCNTGSLLDHVYWTGSADAIYCEVIGCYWSDHFIVATHIDYTISNSSVSENVKSNTTVVMTRTDENVLDHCNNLATHSSSSATNIRLNRMSITEEDDCFESLEPTIDSNSFASHFDVNQPEIQYSSCPIDIRLNRMSITEEDECVVAFESKRLNRMSLTDDDEGVVAFRPIIYTDYNSLASHFDDLMGSKTQIFVSVDTSDFFLRFPCQSMRLHQMDTVYYILGRYRQDYI